MKTIKHLPKSVYSSLRSSVILFDLPRVVEELICNSVDACATKVFVSLGIESCYVEVDDNGCGISRDGLVLLGERHASSKLDILADMTINVESLAFRGETLGSLSDVSLVEVRTKARGKPHAYCKILKGWKCVFLGIDDQREGVGTTVIVRDLFYNQPVRRKYLHSSVKNVLHSVKKCVLRVALVHPQISFRVMDKESECELLCTIPSTSPLRLVSDSFGDEVSSSLHEIAFVDQVFKLSGYLSDPTDAFSTRAFQYLYINSRFVCKGPIHNLLNKLATSSQHSSTLQRVEHELNSGKRQRAQGYPAFMLNLYCPLSSFDLTFEPSKTTIEFKDWPTVLAFFEKAVRYFWKVLLPQSPKGKAFSCQDSEPIKRYVHAGSESVRREIQEEGTLKSSDTRKRKCNFRFSPSHSTIAECLDISSEVRNVSHKHGKLLEDLSILFPELKPCCNEVGHARNIDYSFQDDVLGERVSFISTDGQIGFPKSISQHSMHDIGSYLADDFFSSDQTLKVNKVHDISGLICKINSPGADGSFIEGSTGSIVIPDPYGAMDNVQDAPFTFACPSVLCKPSENSSSFMQNEQDHSSSCAYGGGIGVSFNHSRPLFLDSDSLDANYAYYNCGSKNILMTPLQEHSIGSMASLSILKKCNKTRNFDASLDGLLHPCSFDLPSGVKGSTLYDELASQTWESGSGSVSTETKWFPDSSHSLPGRSLARDDNFTPEHDSNGNLRSIERVCGRKFGLEVSDKEFPDFSNIVQQDFHETLPGTSFKKAKLDHRYCSSSKETVYTEHPPDDINYDKVCPYKLNDETGSLCFNTPIEGHIASYKRSMCHIGHPVYCKEGENTWNEQEYQDCRLLYLPKLRSRRTFSAPPFYEGKKKFSTLNDGRITMDGKETSLQLPSDSNTLPENICSLDKTAQTSQACNSSESYSEHTHDASTREFTGARPVTQEWNLAQRNKEFQEANCNHTPKANAFEDGVVNEQECATVTLAKWRNDNSQPTVGCIPYIKPDHEDDILDISSGLLHLVGGSLVPESINRDCLEDARVLLQLDKKFIPLMAKGVLVILDQHAADERIRLEELRRKVLSGEGCSISYLDSLQDLILPEACIQLLQNYAEQILKWGWICNMDCQSFSKNMNLLRKQSFGVTLVAVPCILGINLTDKDLIEYLGQLAETDGSSTLPPAVIRILNFKACRGAIMFGDSLLPSECSLIVEELKATSLWLQCAHGRPTAVPLLNIAALHQQLSKFEIRMDNLGETWHGLHQHRPSIERAQRRLASAQQYRNG